MYAVADINGFQFKLVKGQVLKVPRYDAEIGVKVSIPKVLIIGDGDNSVIGSPYVDSAVIEATVKGHGKYAKIHIFKKKRRKDYSKKTGHRQGYTEIQIDSITVG